MSKGSREAAESAEARLCEWRGLNSGSERSFAKRRGSAALRMARAEQWRRAQPRADYIVHTGDVKSYDEGKEEWP